MRGFLVLVALLVTGFTQVCLLAQDRRGSADLFDASMEDLMKVDIDSVYAASGYKQKITDAPASVTIITSDDIRKYGYRTLADILSNVPGFYVTYDRNYSYLGIRGFGRPGDYNSRILLLVDGHRLNDDVYDQALVGTDFPIDVDLIDRVEVVRGPNSSMYVASAFLGVINVITTQPRFGRNLTAAAELASYGTFKTRLTLSNRFQSGLDMLLSGSFYDSQGHERLYFPEFNSPATNYGIAQDCDGDQSRQAFANLSYHGFVLQGAYGWRQKNIPTASFGTIFDDPGERTIDAPGYLDFKYDRKFGGDWGYKARIYYDRYNSRGTYPYDASGKGGPPRVLNEDFAIGQRWGAEFDVSKKLAKQTLIGGAEYRDNFQQDQQNYDVQPFVQYLNDRRSSRIEAVFVQDALTFRRNVVLDLGLRYDHYSTFGGTTNPRAALIYSPFERTTVKFLYGQAFRAPNAYESYYGDGTSIEPNPRLRPETVKTTEVVLEQSFRGNLRLNVSGYFYPIRRLISEQEDSATGLIVYRNSDRINMQGLELALNKGLRGGLEAGGSLSFENARNVDTGGPLTNSPRQLGQTHLSVPLFKRQLFASMNLEYVSKRRTLAGNYAGAYVVPNLTLFSQGALRGWELSASVYNMFDEFYGAPGSQEHRQDIIHQDGRRVRIKIARRF